MKHTKRILAIVLCFAILFSSSLVFFSSATAASLTQQKDELSSLLAAQKAEQKKYSALLAEARKDVNKQTQVVQYLYAEINSCQAQVSTVNALILEYSALAEKKEQEIDELNARIDSNFELFKERLVFAQESGSMSYIDFILGSADLSDIISRSEVVNDMLEYDRKIIEGLIADREAVEKAKEEIDLALKSSEEKKAELDALYADLEAKQAEANSVLEQLRGDQNRLNAAYQTIEAAKKKTESDLQAVMDRIAAESAASGSPAPSGFVWPLPAAYPGYISQQFGNGHRGVDIAVGGWAYNDRIAVLAIADGTVKEVISHYSWGVYVLIDHGGGFVARYCHLAEDSPCVSVGQRVARGQQIARVGSTGNSTGPHLHLELQIPKGGNTSGLTNPMNYLVKP